MTSALYETDFYAWTQRQAELLREEEFEQVDWDNLIEEIESLGASERRELDSRLTTILEHMLKLVCEPDSKAVRKWRRTILTQRIALVKLLRENHTLRATADDFVGMAYLDARKLAASGTRCAVDTFPVECPWTAEQVMDEEFWPGAQ